MYLMRDNQDASTFDLYLRETLVASLHYCLEENEILFVYCEAIAATDADRHCQELMQWALNESLSRRLKVTINCPIALARLRENAANLNDERLLMTRAG